MHNSGGIWFYLKVSWLCKLQEICSVENKEETKLKRRKVKCDFLNPKNLHIYAQTDKQ